MSTVVVLLLLLLLVAFLGALIGVVLAVRSLLRRAKRMTVELGELSKDISDNVRLGNVADRAAVDGVHLPYDDSKA